MEREATFYLLDKGGKITRTDAGSWEAPFAHAVHRYAQEKDSSLTCKGHKAGREKEDCHLEKRHHLQPP
ncbi:hypothetical protein [Candidatus Protochlamydia phocaeensis]|uniref:hypothetical protein n=1 Tax=Candidatus Protochlamydia phocaeensis TaxID=1414722 RepID=UPI00083802E7|nr:hypothetical protein [Candidatus Protochlamydia phocaeensis]